MPTTRIRCRRMLVPALRRTTFRDVCGSGEIINPARVILTNKRVIKDATVIKVMFSNRIQMPAQLIAAALLVHLAVLKVNLPEPLPALQIVNSDKPQMGQTVITVGNPLDLRTSVSVGVVSAMVRHFMRSPLDDYIQTDAAINTGQFWRTDDGLFWHGPRHRHGAVVEP